MLVDKFKVKTEKGKVFIMETHQRFIDGVGLQKELKIAKYGLSEVLEEGKKWVFIGVNGDIVVTRV